MKIEGIKPRKNLTTMARTRYSHWHRRTKEAPVYKSILFGLCRGKCPICEVDMVLSFNDTVKKQKNAATLDHTIPISKTLEHSKYGLEIMCLDCNQKKGNTFVSNGKANNT